TAADDVGDPAAAPREELGVRRELEGCAASDRESSEAVPDREHADCVDRGPGLEHLDRGLREAEHAPLGLVDDDPADVDRRKRDVAGAGIVKSAADLAQERVDGVAES